MDSIAAIRRATRSPHYSSREDDHSNLLGHPSKVLPEVPTTLGELSVSDNHAAAKLCVDFAINLRYFFQGNGGRRSRTTDHRSCTPIALPLSYPTITVPSANYFLRLNKIRLMRPMLAVTIDDGSGIAVADTHPLLVDSRTLIAPSRPALFGKRKSVDLTPATK